MKSTINKKVKKDSTRGFKPSYANPNKSASRSVAQKSSNGQGTTILQYQIGKGGLNTRDWEEDTYAYLGKAYGKHATYLFHHDDYMPLRVYASNVFGPEYANALPYKKKKKVARATAGAKEATTSQATNTSRRTASRTRSGATTTSSTTAVTSTSGRQSGYGGDGSSDSNDSSDSSTSDSSSSEDEEAVLRLTKDQTKALARLNSGALKDYKNWSDDYTKIYYEIVERISKASMEAIKVLPDFDPMDQDPLLLIRAIKKTHVASGLDDPELDLNNLHNNYQTMRQYPNEEIFDFKRRMEKVIEDMENCGHREPNNIQVSSFLNKLDLGRYADFKQYLIDKKMSSSKQKYPKTLDEVYKALNKYMATRLPSSSGAVTSQSVVFNGKAEYPKKRKPSGGESNPKGKTSKFHSKNPAGKSEGAQEKRVCFNCGKQGHLAKDCKSEKKDDAANVLLEDKDFGCMCEEVEEHDEVIAASVSGFNAKDAIIMDSGSTVSAFCNKSLMKNIRKAKRPCFVRGFGGRVHLGLEGDTEEFGVV